MSSTDTESEKWVMMAVLDHLQKAASTPGMNVESLQEAIFAISNAYTLNMHSSSTKQRYPLNNLSLPHIYQVGRQSLLNNATDDTPPTTTTTPTTTPIVTDVGFEKFVEKLLTSTAFFQGVDKGSDEYTKRMTLARRKYDQKLQAKKQKLNESQPETTKSEPIASTSTQSEPRTSTATQSESAAVTSPPNSSSAEEKAKAEVIKKRGNAQLKAKQYESALESYSECIKLDNKNAVYYSNRAAANILLSRFTDAVDDCKKAISIDQSFERPRERLASAYRHLGMTKKEVEGLKSACTKFPSNVTFINMLADAENRLRLENNDTTMNGSGTGTGAPGAAIDPAMIDMMSRSVGINLPDGLAQTLANSVGNMARDNPAMVQQMMGMMSGAGAGGGGAGAGGAGGGAGGGGGGNAMMEQMMRMMGGGAGSNGTG